MMNLVRDGITIVQVSNPTEGFSHASSFLYKNLDKKTVLYLSGGRTPKELYEQLAREGKLEIGSVGLVDERYGEKFHENSNELMIKNAGLLRYLELSDTPFYPILKKDLSLEKTAEEYDGSVRFLMNQFKKTVSILGIGLDGHTAGLPAQNSKFNPSTTLRARVQNAKLNYNEYDLVTSYTDSVPMEKGGYGKRITMTFRALELMDHLVVLVFGKDKKEALELMFENGSIEEVPARFLKKEHISKKTLLITDQSV